MKIGSYKPTLGMGDIATISVLVATYGAHFIQRPETIGSSESIILILCGVVYGFFCTIGFDYLACSGRLPPLIVYFLLAMTLGGYINWASNGNLWLILIPLTSQGIITLPRPLGFTLSGVIWLLGTISLGLLHGWDGLWTWGTPMAAAIIFVVIFSFITLSERDARAELAKTHQKLLEYTAQAEELATVRERNRLAREIHDGLGHYLTAIHIQIKAAQAMVESNPKTALEALTKAQTMTEEALSDVRRSVHALRADPTTGRPLAEILESLLSGLQEAGLQTTFKVCGQSFLLAPQAELALYRVTQEALTNIRKHARAHKASLQLEYTPKEVTLTIEDDGLGAEPQEGGFGLLGLKERLEMLGGFLETRSAPGQGFTLKAVLPKSEALSNDQ